MTMTRRRTDCCICGKTMSTKLCPHPWRTAFSDWPPELIAEVQRAAPHGYDGMR